MIRPTPRSTLFPTRRSSDLGQRLTQVHVAEGDVARFVAQHVFRQTAQQRTGGVLAHVVKGGQRQPLDRKSTRLNSSHVSISYAVFCLKKKIPFVMIPSFVW